MRLTPINMSIRITKQTPIYKVFKDWIEIWQPIIAVVGTQYELIDNDLLSKRDYIQKIVDNVEALGYFHINTSRLQPEKIVKLRTPLLQSIERAQEIYSWGNDSNGYFNEQLLHECIVKDFQEKQRDKVRHLIPVDNTDLDQLLQQAIKKQNIDQPFGTTKQYKRNNPPPPPPPPPKKYISDDGSHIQSTFKISYSLIIGLVGWAIAVTLLMVWLLR